MLNRLGLGVLGLVMCGLAAAAEWNLQPADSMMAAHIHWLHAAIMLLVIVLFVGVFGVMFWSCYAHRKSVGPKAVQFHKNIMVEILWTVIPAIILALVAWPVTKVVIAQNEGAINRMPKIATQPFKQSDNVELAAAVKGQSKLR